MAAVLAGGPTHPGLATRLFSLTGSPAISVSMGTGTTGLPLGLQIAAGANAQALVYRIAESFEKALPHP